MSLMTEEKVIPAPEEKPIPPTEEVKSAITDLNENDEPFDGEEPEIDLFNELSKPTDKDEAGAKEQKKEEPAAPGDNKSVISTLNTANSVAANKAELTATLAVNAINVAGSLVLQAISDEWTEDSERRYKMTPTQKKELIEPLTDILKQRAAEGKGKPANPVIILVVTVIICYIPMFISAFRTRKEKIEKKREALKKKAAEEKAAAEGDTSYTYESETEDRPSQLEKVVEVQKPGTFTPDQIRKRVAEIKAKKGRRSKEDAEFMESIGLGEA